MTYAPVVVVALHANGQGTQGPFDGVEGRLPAQIVVDDGPRGGWPAVVELPDQRTATVPVFPPLSTPASVSVGNGFTLRQLGEVYPGLTTVLAQSYTSQAIQHSRIDLGRFGSFPQCRSQCVFHGNLLCCENRGRGIVDTDPVSC